MVHLLRPAYGLAKSCKLRISRPLRLFTSSCPVLTASVVGEPPVATNHSTSRKVTKTKKAFGELPKVWTKPDGTPAAPLDAWSGGLENSSQPEGEDASSDIHTRVELRRRMSEILSRTSDPAMESSAIEQADASEDLAQESKTCDNSASTARPRRTRKKKVVVAESSTEHLNEAEDRVEIPIRADDETKIKRRRKKRQADTVIECTEDNQEPRPPKTPLAAEILANLAKFPHCILLTRVGQFYESYFEQAAEVSQLLNIKLAEKTWSGQRVLMCGFPVMHLDKYLKTLVQGHNRFVALCEEFMRSRSLGPKGGFDRRVTRIVTPGTLIDEPFLNQYENNYLLAIERPSSSTCSDDPIGLAWIDVSTGEFFAKHVTFDSLRDELVRIGPKEIVLQLALAEAPTDPIRQTVAEEELFTSFISPCPHEDVLDVPPSTSARSGSDDLSTHTEPSASLMHLTLTDAEVAAVKLLTAYLHANLLEHMPRLPSPSREASAGRMQIDAHTIKALEIKESIREGGTMGSLLSVTKRTITSGGTRLLARWLCSPSTSLKEINARQSLVAFFYDRPDLRADLTQSLGAIEDASRIVQKFLLGRGDVSDLQAIRATIELWTSIKARIELERKMEQEERGVIVDDEWAGIDALMSRLDSLHDLVGRIQAAVAGSAPAEELTSADAADEDEVSPEPEGTFVPTGWTIRPDFSEELTRLHAHLADCLVRKENMERHLQVTYDAPSLTLRSSPGQGMHVHIARAKRDSPRIRKDPLFVPITEGNTICTFFYQMWSQLGSEIVETSNAVFNTERDAFETLRADVNAHEPAIRRNSRILDELDITLAFANLAQELNFCRPTLREDMTYHVVNGRHPSVELGLLEAGRVFTPNTVTFPENNPLHIITGPNMAGKSTLLRQTALIAILAQTGSFVPADSAEIGIVDRVFSRVGAKDDLFRDRSTFMVEMLETSDILRRATPRSLVIMDEVGRGTTVEDGLAIAFATVHHLLSVNQSRTLFATHFHELADMLGYSGEHKGQFPFHRVSFFCTDVDETEDGYFAYSHRLRPGVNRNSHGIKVARLAGMPDAAVGVAQTALSWLKKRRAGTVDEDRALLQSLGHDLAMQKPVTDTIT